MISDLPPEPPVKYEQVVSQPASILEEKAKIPPIRYQAISDGAFAYGAQAGNASMSYKILKKLEKLEPILNRSMNFDLLMLDKNVVPPVLVESHGSMSQDGDTVSLYHCAVVMARLPPYWAQL